MGDAEGMTDRDTATEVAQTFHRAEQTGLKLAIRGRFVALVGLGLWLGLSRSAPIAYYYLGLLLAFGFLGLLHYVIIGTPHDRRWVKYVFITLDIALLAFAMAVSPMTNAVDLPPVLIFRFNLLPYFFVVLAVAAFSFSPGLVLWSGVASCAAWLGIFTWIVGTMETTLGWSDIPPDATAEHYLAVFLDPNFIGAGSRVQESIVLLVVTVLLAAVMHRARRTVQRQVEAEGERESVSRTFGRYLPEAVVEALVAEQGRLEPVQREATVLFADIAGFTALTEEAGPARTFAVLNAYFDAVTKAIGRHKGVVTQFQGDAVLATFNVPLEDPDHAASAIRAALDIRAVTDGMTFDGAPITVRMGINSGDLVAGSVGGEGRQSYTVHGDPVNVAARLEALNKEFGTRILLSEETVSRAGANFRFREVAETAVRGLERTVRVYTIAG